MSGGGIVSDTNDETGILARAIEEMRIALKSTLSGLKDEIDRRKNTEDDLRMPGITWRIRFRKGPLN